MYSSDQHYRNLIIKPLLTVLDTYLSLQNSSDTSYQRDGDHPMEVASEPGVSLRRVGQHRQNQSIRNSLLFFAARR